MGDALTTLLLDSQALHWWSAEPERLSVSAATAIIGADDVAVAAISWFELAWMEEHERITLTIPIRSWLEHLAVLVRTVPLTPAVAATALSLPSSFPGDP